MKKTYTIKFNEDRDYMLSAVFHFLVMEHGEEFTTFMGEVGVADEFAAFLHEKAEMNHRLGWCKDPNCERPNATTK